ncbi:MAG: asparagine synthase (glutamine-hydrolyzing) [Hyphomonas sp.]|uniref:asparagine synthase (glutamine-hydrolyzing) n=1 Tax=Hyphomonas sp. TaxID=87 RepID=UPI0025C0DEF4|nr:asparagine synthase (glutamine-hydrolyzing) [Hyphomonas sp.]MBA4338928.1 asparagine synthase (glutamine-hydrolyzing) [Hyphomonas sp.]
MCGIAGFLRASEAYDPGDEALLGQMASLLRHRGPDSGGVWAGQGVGLAHRRLAVIAPTPEGRQPMQRGGGRWSISFNGEIYNYREVRADLEAIGEVFATQTDTEVLMAALIRWGEDALLRLNGMFAFAFWDGHSRTLMLARDRIGEKPLYYAFAGQDLVFASEIKALFPWRALKRRPDYQAIHHYLALQYVPTPLTAFEGIRKLPPGSVLTLSPGRSDVQPRRYWSLPEPTQTHAPVGTTEDVRAEARERLALAVRRRMVSDVPIGAFLSGGVDSSSVTALMALEAGAGIKTFSIGFAEDGYDERRFARQVSQRYETDHYEEVVSPDAAAILPELVWHYGEPFADPSAIPTYYVSRLARRHITVALTGDGGDEFFIGYGRYRDCQNTKWVDALPGFVRSSAGAVASFIPASMAGTRFVRGGKRLLQYASSTKSRRYEPMMMYFHDSDKEAGYGEMLRPWLGESSTGLLEPYFKQAHSMTAGAAWADIHTYLPDDLLVKVDVASMALGLECRAPFLDVELMEWASGLPLEVRLSEGELKGLLKEAVAPLLPDIIISRPKMGFGAPIDFWLRAEFFDMAGEILTGRPAADRGLFKPGYAEQLLREHRLGHRQNHTRLWAMIMLELWFQMWIDPLEFPAGPQREV